MRSLAIAVMLAGCAELGVTGDGTSLSIGRASGGALVDGVRLPNRGDGFVTREVWRARDNRYGTDELVDLITAVGRRMRAEARDVKLVVADLSGRGGSERAFHRSHQSGRDADLLYYMRDADGRAFEPDAMHAFDATARAVDGSGLTIDVPRTWRLVKELITAPEAAVQWVFMYEPIARRLLDHAARVGEPEALIARARKALKQPGASARHDDHLHVRVYCSAADRAYGCVDFGPMELYAERAAEPSVVAAFLGALPSSASGGDEVAATTARVEPVASAAVASASGGSRAPIGRERLGRLLRTRIDRMYLRGWR
jgi:penicillin-insensitive murein DD-endopeptidase